MGNRSISCRKIGKTGVYDKELDASPNSARNNQENRPMQISRVRSVSYRAFLKLTDSGAMRSPTVILDSSAR